MGLQQDIAAAAERALGAHRMTEEWTRGDIQRDAMLLMLQAMAIELNALRQEVEMLKA